MSTAQAVAQWNVMVSSRMVEFEPERLAAQRGIAAAGMAPWTVEDRPSRFSHLTAPNDLCKGMAEQCDLLLLILGPTYGYQPDGQPAGAEKSATQLEFEWARARRPNKVIVFVREDALTTRDQQQHDFIDSVGAFNTGYTFTKFRTPQQLEDEVRAALVDRRSHESLDVSRYLEAVRDAYAKLVNPITGAEMDAKTTVLLQLRTEVEDRPTRRTWEEAVGEASRDIFHPLAQFKRFRPTKQSDRMDPLPLAASLAAPEVESADHFLAKYGRFVLQGDPGAGKSTLLRRLAFSAAQRGLGISGTAPSSGMPITPVYVTAVELGKALTLHPGAGLAAGLIQALREQGLDGADVAVEAALNAGQAMVLVDGLDEVALDDQRTVIFEVLRRDVGTNQAILAARPSAYQEGILAGWRVCEVQQLDAELRLLLISGVFQQITRQTGRAIAVAPVTLKGELDGREDLRAWAGNPLLLTLITSQYALNGNLPRQRAVIYRLALDRLIDSPYRQAAPRQQQIARDQLEEMLERLALHMMEQSLVSAELVAPAEEKAGEAALARPPRRAGELPRPNDIAHMAALGDTPLSEVEVRELVDRSGVIQRQSGNQYGFIHLTFQEYFAARALADPKTSTAQRQDYIERRRLSARWEQVTLLLVSELDRRHEQSAARREPEADVLVRALMQADAKAVRRLGGRDPLHLALIRASAAQRERGDVSASAPLSTRLEQKWTRIWRIALWRRLVRFNDDDDLLMMLGMTFGIAAAVGAALVAGIWADIGLDHWITGVLGVVLGIVVGIVAAAIVGFIGLIAAVVIPLIALSDLSSDSSPSYPDSSVTEERAGQELSASSPTVTQLLQHRPDPEVLSDVTVGALGIALIGLVVAGVALALIYLPFSAANVGHWLRTALTYELLAVVVVSLAGLASWRIAFGRTLRADGADRLVENRGAEDCIMLAGLLDGYSYRTPAKLALQHLGPAAAPALPRVQAVASSGNALERADALAVIGSMGAAAAPAIPTAVGAASASDRGVRIAAVAALAQLKRLNALDAQALTRVLQDLAKQLASTTTSESNSARDVLVALGPAAAPVTAEIRASGGSGDYTVRGNAQRVLASIQGNSATDATAKPSFSAATSNRSPATIDAQRLKDLRTRALHGSLQTGPTGRQQAIAELAESGPSKIVVRTLIVAMRDGDPTVRASAVDALGRLGPAAERALPYLLDAARDRAGALGAWLLGALEILIVWPALVVFVLDQLVINRPQAELAHWIGLLPRSVQPAVASGVEALRAHADFLSFLEASAIYFALVLLVMTLHNFFSKRRHVVRDSAMRVLPAFLANIEDAGT